MEMAYSRRSTIVIKKIRTMKLIHFQHTYNNISFKLTENFTMYKREMKPRFIVIRLVKGFDCYVTMFFFNFNQKEGKIRDTFDKLNIYNSSHKLHIILCTEVIKQINIILINKQTLFKTKETPVIEFTKPRIEDPIKSPFLQASQSPHLSLIRIGYPNLPSILVIQSSSSRDLPQGKGIKGRLFV